jgi:predicted Zn-dependent peptidase
MAKKLIYILLFLGFMNASAQSRKQKPQQETLANGLEVIYFPSEDSLVHFQYIIHAGYANIANFTEHSLQLLKYALLCENEALNSEDMVYAHKTFGSSLSVSQHANDIIIRFDCSKSQLSEALDLLGSMANSSRFNNNCLMAQKNFEKSTLFNPYIKNNDALVAQITQSYLLSPTNQLNTAQFEAQNVDGLNSIIPLLISANNSTLLLSYQSDESIESSLDSAFKTFKAGIPFPIENLAYPLNEVKDKQFIYLQRIGTPFTQFSFIRPAPTVMDKDFWAFQLCLYLFERHVQNETLQNDKFWCTFSSTQHPENMQGYYSINIKCSPEDEIKVNAFWDEIAYKFSEKGINVSQSNIAIQEFKQRFSALSTEDAFYYNNPFLFGDFDAMEKIKEELSKLSEKELNDAVKKYFSKDAYYCIAIAEREPFGNSITNFRRLSIDQLDVR